MTISYVNQQTLNNGAGTTTSIPFLIPTNAPLPAADDLLLAVAAVKPYTLNIASGTILTDYTLISDNTNGTVANANGVGSVRQWVYSKTHSGSETNPTGTLDFAPSPRMSTVSVWRKTNPGAWSIAAQDGPDVDETGAGISCTAAATLDLTVGDVLLMIFAGGDNLALSAETLTIPGCTYDALTLINNTNTTTAGNDGWIRFYYVTITSGTATGAPTFTATTTSGKSAATASFIRMREPAAAGSFTADAADSITFSETATTSVAAARSISDTLTLSDAADRTVSQYVSVADTLTLTDSATGVPGTSRDATDSLSLTDSVSATGSRSRSAADTITLSDTAIAERPTYKRGLNLSGAEGAYSGATVPGTYATDYVYPDATLCNYVASRGHRVVRLPFLWERIQPTLGAALDATELTRLQDAVTRIGAAGMQVILDVHNYGRYYTSDDVLHVLGDTDGVLTEAHLTDLWTRLSTAFKTNNDVWAYGLMNEPHDLPAPAIGFTANNTPYTFDSGIQGWGGEGTATAAQDTTLFHDGTGSLKVTRTDLTTGVAGQTIRMNDNNNNTLVVANGDTLAAWVYAPTGTGASQIRARIEFQNSSYSWQIGPETVLTPGTWTQITYTPASGVWAGHKAVGIQFTLDNLTTASVSVNIDTFSQGTTSGGGTAASGWEQVTVGLVNAIRANGDTHTILVPGYNWSGATNWATTHPNGPWVADSNVIYEAHYYFDRDNSGVYANTYAAEVTDAQSRGYADLTARATAEVSNFLDWLSANNVKGLIGEVGWPNSGDTTGWNAVGEALYGLFDTAFVNVTAWAAGQWFSANGLAIYSNSGGAWTPTSVAPTVEAHPTVTGGAVLTGSAADSLTITDAVARSSALVRAASDVINISDSVQGVKGASRAALDTLTITDSATVSGNTRSRSVADSLLLTDAATGVVGTARTASDSVTLSDSVTTTAGRSRTASDSLGLTDAASRSAALSRSVSDSISLTDSASTGPVGRPRSAADSLSLTDTAAQTTTQVRSASDSITLADQADVGGFTKRANDSITLADSVASVVAAARSVSDSVTLTDAVTVQVQRGRLASDALSVTDAAASSVSLSRSVLDTVHITDGAAVTTSGAVTASDALLISDAVAVVMTASRTADDTLSVSDSAQTAVSYVRNVVDGITLDDIAVARARKKAAAGWGMRI